MNTRATLLALAVSLTAAPAPTADAGDGPVKALWNRLTDRPAKAPAAYAPAAYAPAASPQAVATAAPQAQSQAQAGADPYGFAAILNHYRARAGLPAVAYCADLSAWASQNNAEMCRRGLGHFVLNNCVQNCGWNYADAPSAAQGWMGSAAHRDNMLNPGITRFGIAFGPGPYWTLNAR